MKRVSLMAAAVATAFAAGSLISVEAMAQAKPAAAAKPAAKAAAKPAAPKASTVSGMIIAVDTPLQMVTLDNGKTYLIKDAKKFAGMKKGGKVKLSVPPPKAA